MQHTVRRGIDTVLYLHIWVSFFALVSSAGLLQPEAQLVTNCFNFPEEDFNRNNSVRSTFGASPHLVRALGAPAVDFTLHDTDGSPWNLGEVLEAGQGKPVVLVFGMRSCPAYQGLGSGGESRTKWAYWDERRMVEDYGDRANFVHVYGPEPHPEAPDHNFDSGLLLPNYWSVRRQSVTYEDRLEQAKAIRNITHPDQVILPDYLTGNPYSSLNQPVWCSYSNGARSAVMVASRGRIFYQQGWLNTENLGKAIEGYWEQDGEGTWTDEEPIASPLSSASKAAKKKSKTSKGSRKSP